MWTAAAAWTSYTSMRLSFILPHYQYRSRSSPTSSLPPSRCYCLHRPASKTFADPVGASRTSQIQMYRHYCRRFVTCPRSTSGSSGSDDAPSSQQVDEPEEEEFVPPKDFVPSPNFNIKRLEAYTEKNYDESLVVKALLGGDTLEDGMPDEVIIYRGFSAYLTRPTDMNAEVDVLPLEFTTVIEVDRITPPYKLDEEQNDYIERGLSWEEFDQFLKDNGF